MFGICEVRGLLLATGSWVQEKDSDPVGGRRIGGTVHCRWELSSEGKLGAAAWQARMEGVYRNSVFVKGLFPVKGPLRCRDGPASQPMWFA